MGGIVYIGSSVIGFPLNFIQKDLLTELYLGNEVLRDVENELLLLILVLLPFQHGSDA